MRTDTAGFGDVVTAGVVSTNKAHEDMPAPSATFDVECVGPDGAVKWREVINNLVLTGGRTDILEKYFRGSAYTAAWYLLLKGTGTAVAADTLASHGSWTEETPYAGSRPTLAFNAASNGSIACQQESIAITGTATVAGCGLSSVASGTAGILYNAGDFSQAKSVSNGDTLNVTVTINATAS